jgi:hypothetical protein
MAKPNTSRPQPWSELIGVRKKPSVERGPKAITAITQPKVRMTAGVRHVADEEPPSGAGETVIGDFSGDWPRPAAGAP